MSPWSCKTCLYENDNDGLSKCDFCCSLRPHNNTGAVKLMSENNNSNNKRVKKASNGSSSSSTKKTVIIISSSSDSETEQERKEDEMVKENRKMLQKKEASSLSNSNNNKRPRKEEEQEENRPFTVKYAPKSLTEFNSLRGRIKTGEILKQFILNAFISNNKVIIVHGPVGCGKSACINLVAKELNCSIREWNAEEKMPDFVTSRLQDFENFLNVSSYKSVINVPPPAAASSSSLGTMGEIILIENLPLKQTSELFHNNNNNTTASDKALIDVLNRQVQNLNRNANVPCCVIFSFSGGNDRGLHEFELINRLGSNLVKNANLVEFKEITEFKMRKLIKSICEKEKISNGDGIVEEFCESGDVRFVLNSLDFISRTTNMSSSSSSSSSATFDKRDFSYNVMHATGKLLLGKNDFIPEHVSMKCEISSENLLGWLHNNMHLFVGDLQDWSEILDLYGFADLLIHDGYNGQLEGASNAGEEEDAGGLRTQKRMSGTERVADSILTRAVLTLNRRMKQKPDRLIPIRKPQMFDISKLISLKRNSILAFKNDTINLKDKITDIYPFSSFFHTRNENNNKPYVDDDGVNHSFKQFDRVNNVTMEYLLSTRNGMRMMPGAGGEETMLLMNDNNNRELEDDPIE